MLSEQKRTEVRKQYVILKSYTKVAEKCKVPRRTVGSVIRNKPWKTDKPMGRPNKLTKRDCRQMKRHITKEVQTGHRVTSRSIKGNLGLEDVSMRTIQRALNRDNVFYEISNKKLPLTDKHKQDRLNFAR